MRLKLIAICCMLLILVGGAAGQRMLSAECASAVSFQLGCSRDARAAPGSANSLFVDLLSRFPMAPESALQVFEREGERQALVLQGYSATTLINAELPDMLRHGEFELRRIYVAPKTLEFIPLRFTGDRFVKTNVIARLLQSEVDNLRDPKKFATAVNETNYRIYYKNTTQIDGRLVHVYQLKPQKRRVGLFEGRMSLDAFTGGLVRNEGKLVKTPSLLLKKVEFVQDYVNVNGFTFPEHVHSAASIRVIGRAVVDIYNYNYLPAAASPVIANGQTLAEAATTLEELGFEPWGAQLENVTSPGSRGR